MAARHVFRIDTKKAASRTTGLSVWRALCGSLHALNEDRLVLSADCIPTLIICAVLGCGSVLMLTDAAAADCRRCLNVLCCACCVLFTSSADAQPEDAALQHNEPPSSACTYLGYCSAPC
jgi:hypothetical protein